MQVFHRSSNWTRRDTAFHLSKCLVHLCVPKPNREIRHIWAIEGYQTQYATKIHWWGCSTCLELTKMAFLQQWTLAKAYSCNKMPPALQGIAGKEITTACLHEGDTRQKRQRMHCQRSRCIYIFGISESALVRALNSNHSDEAQWALGDSHTQPRLQVPPA